MIPEAAKETINRGFILSENKPVIIHILGVEYPVKGDFEPEYIRKIAANLDHRLREMSKHLPGKSNEKTAVLTALNLEDELNAEKTHCEGLLSSLEERTNKIIKRIDEVLEESDGKS